MPEASEPGADLKKGAAFKQELCLKPVSQELTLKKELFLKPVNQELSEKELRLKPKSQ